MLSLDQILEPPEFIAEFCARWKISELSLFGSVLRDDFRPESDLDILVTFAPGARWSLPDQVRMEDELADFFGRKIDLVNRRAIEKSKNWIRRDAILGQTRTLHAA